MSHFPLKPSVISSGIDFILIRELVGILFWKKNKGKDSRGQRFVEESLEYDEKQIRRILMIAFELASKRKRQQIHNVHKSNVLLSSVLWNEILEKWAQITQCFSKKHAS